MTPEAKRQLSTTIRALRERLLRDLHAGADSAYRLSVRAQDAGLPEAARQRRLRLEGWIDEQVRAEAEARLAARRKPGWSEEKTRQERATILAELGKDGLQARFLDEAVKQAASTLLNRLVLLRLLEAPRGDGPGNGNAAPLRAPAVVTGGWESVGYRDFRQLAPALVRGDETEGYGFLLRLLFEDLATELPGVFGPAGVADLLPVPAATLRSVVEALDEPALAGCWTDDLTLGWVYQYWNDPEREALDVKLNAGEKLEPHEIASKTQMFTERYMVDWLLQNSLGPMWLAICRKHGWTADCAGAHDPAPGGAGGAAGASAGTPLLDRLEARRVGWRAARDLRQRELEALRERQARGADLDVTEESLPGVSLTELMPLHTEAERRWAYFVPQPIPEDAVKQAPDSVRDLRILDPAVGSGHFLVVAFDLLAALYREEARHRGEAGSQPTAGEAAGRWSEKAIAERILEHNLHGVDLDPRAVQIAAASLWLKARQSCPEARPRRLNLVASDLSLSGLPDDDPALEELRREVARETGIPAALTDAVVHALQGADHLGSLLKVDAAVDEAIRQHEAELARTAPSQGDLWAGFAEPRQMAIPAAEARATVLERLEGFLARHTGGEDLGLRLRGEQLAAGVRFVRMLREGTYDLVVGNPPYQGTSKMADAAYVKKHYPRGKADLYAAFLERGLQLAREGGTSALLTMRNWMFIKQSADIRTWLLETYDLRGLGDLAIGAFDEVPNDLLSVVVSVFRKSSPQPEQSVALQPTPPDDRSYDRERTRRKRAAVRCQVGRHQFDPQALKAVPEWPVVYWWNEDLFALYRESKKIGEESPACKGLITSDDMRFIRKPHELCLNTIFISHWNFKARPIRETWCPLIKGAIGRAWFEDLSDAVEWARSGLQIKVKNEDAAGGRINSSVVSFSHGV